MEIINNNVPSLLDFSPVRKLYILILLAHRKKVSVDSLEEEDRDYVFKSLTPSAKLFVEERIVITPEPHKTMLRDLLDGEFTPESVQLNIIIYSENIWMLDILPHDLRQLEILTLLGFPPKIVYKELDNITGDPFKNSQVYDISCYIHLHCNIDSTDGWRLQYSEHLADYFSKSDILSKHYRPFIDRVSGAKSMIRILAENNFWELYEVYLRQELYKIEGMAIEKALNALKLDEVKKSQKLMQLAGLASSHGGWFGEINPAVVSTFKEIPPMLFPDRYLTELLPKNEIKKPDLILPTEEPLKQEQQLTTANSNDNNGSGDEEDD